MWLRERLARWQERFSSLALPAIWVIAYLVTSTLLFGLAFSVVFAIQGADGMFAHPPTNNASDVTSFAVVIYSYGVFVWTLMAVVTLPVTVLPVIAWVSLAKGLQWFESSRIDLVLGTLAMAMVAFVAREIYLDYPGFVHNPINALQGRWASAGYALSALVSIWGGLALPRLCLPELGLGVFADGDAVAPVAS